MIPSFEKLHAYQSRLVLNFGGDSSASQTTKNVDARVVGGNDSANVSNQDGTVNVVATDHGAVKSAFDLGAMAIDKTTTTANTLFHDSITAMDSANKSAIGAISAASDNLAKAYENGQAGDQKVLKIAGFVIVGIVALKAFGK